MHVPASMHKWLAAYARRYTYMHVESTFVRIHVRSHARNNATCDIKVHWMLGYPMLKSKIRPGLLDLGPIDIHVHSNLIQLDPTKIRSKVHGLPQSNSRFNTRLQSNYVLWDKIWPLIIVKKIQDILYKNYPIGFIFKRIF
jgi:hypothetical protein